MRHNPYRTCTITATILVALLLAPMPAVTDPPAEGTPPPRFVEPPTTALPLPPTGVSAADVPDDAGGALQVTWRLPPGSDADSLILHRYPESGDATRAARLAGDVESCVDSEAGSEPVRYAVELFAGDASALSALSAAAAARGNWFNTQRHNQLILLSVLIAAIAYFTFHAARGREFYIRKIAGLEAVDEAVGRATEMGRSVLFIPGINDLDDVQTLAGLTILGTLAKKIAQYETTLDVPVSKSLVMSTGRETVREAYLLAGRPDLYSDDIVHYITDEQFGYVAAVDGIMVRDKPAACFYLGAFFAESLILAETGNSIGAIQVAGTAMPTQLPFFVAACDYTLIGEELFAASAYLSRDLKLIGSLRGQDVGKMLAMAGIAVGVLAATVGWGTIEAACHWLFKVN